MADLNALIAQGAKFDMPNPINQMAQMMQMRHLQDQSALAPVQLQHAQQQNQMNQLLMQEKQRGFQEQNAVRTLMGRPGFTLANPEHVRELHYTAPNIADPIYKNYLANAKMLGDINAQPGTAAHVEAQTNDLNAKTLDAQLTNFNKRFSPLSVNGPDDVRAYTAAMYNHPVLGPLAAQMRPLDEALRTNLDEFAKNPKLWQAAHAQLSGKDIFDALKGTRQNVNLGNVSQGSTIDAFGNVVPGSQTNTAIGAVPSTDAALETAAAATSRARTDEARLKQSEEHFTRKLAEETAAGVLTPDTLEFAGQLVAQGGAMPSLGSGKAAAKMKQQVLDRAAQISTADGSSGAEAAAKMLTARAGQAGATTAERVLGSQGANVLLASSEAKKMIRVASDYSSLVDRSQYPTLNSIQNAVDKGTGGENIVALNTALNALVNSYARAINPKGVSTVSDKNHAREIVNSSYSNGQLNTVFKVMDKEMTAALESTGAARAVLRGKPEPAAGATPTAKPSLDEIFR